MAVLDLIWTPWQPHTPLSVCSVRRQQTCSNVCLKLGRWKRRISAFNISHRALIVSAVKYCRLGDTVPLQAGPLWGLWLYIPAFLPLVQCLPWHFLWRRRRSRPGEGGSWRPRSWPRPRVDTQIPAWFISHSHFCTCTRQISRECGLTVE